MSSYHSSFTYLGVNSAEDKRLIIASFDPDNGEHDTFLSMEPVFATSYDGTRRFDYGAKYNSNAVISITVIKADKSDFTVAENRDLLRWLTGSRVNSWLDLYEGDDFKYSFWGRITNVQQYKMDARVIGLILEFTSTSPWAWSAPQKHEHYMGEGILEIDDNNVIYKNDKITYLGVDSNGVLFNDYVNSKKSFSITDDGVVYNDMVVRIDIDNDSDDLYTYTNLDMYYSNEVGVDGGAELIIENTTLGETTTFSGISEKENITISGNYFVTTDVPNKVFGDDFNFVFPRLQPGKNDFVIDGTGKGSVRFEFRYPIKIGDCAADVNNLIGNWSLCQ